MNKTITSIVSMLVLLVATAPSMAQGANTPSFRAGDMAVSGNLGFAHAFDDDFDGTEPIITGTFEYHTSENISWRGLLGLTSFEARFSGGSVEVDMFIFNANIVYGWQAEGLRPYVTGGVGLYNEDASPAVRGAGDDLELGFNFGGGLDLYLTQEWAIKFEGTFHGISGDEPDSFFAATVGAKYQF